MLIESEIADNSINDEWAVQSEKWIANTGKFQKHRRRRQKNPNPLILTGHGTSIRIERDTLLIKEGFTHYPQKQSQYRFFRGDLKLPHLIILIDGSGSLSIDAMSWLAEQSTSLARIKWDGSVAMMMSNTGFAANQKKVDWQRKTRADDADRLEFSRNLISRKLEASIKTLRTGVPKTELRDKAIERAEQSIVKLAGKPKDVAEVRSIEGECGSFYFRCWNAVPLKWELSQKYPIPDHWLEYRFRASLRDAKPVNFGATDPVNAMMNYAYAVLRTKMQIAAVVDGYDPTLGIMHHTNSDFPAYVYDIMELERPRVDAAILKFIKKHKFSGADFTLNNRGICRLSPQLARTVATLV